MSRYLLSIFLYFIILMTSSALYGYNVSINIINLSEYNINASYNNSDGMGSWGLVGANNETTIGVGSSSNGINSFSNISEFNLSWTSNNSYFCIQIYDTFLLLNTPGYSTSQADALILIPSTDTIYNATVYYTTFVPNPRTTDSSYHEWYFKETTDLIFAGVNANTIGGGLEIIASNGQYWNQTTGIVVLYPELVGSTMQTELNNFFDDNIIGSTSSDSE